MIILGLVFHRHAAAVRQPPAGPVAGDEAHRRRIAAVIPSQDTQDTVGRAIATPLVPWGDRQLLYILRARSSSVARPGCVSSWPARLYWAGRPTGPILIWCGRRWAK